MLGLAAPCFAQTPASTALSPEEALRDTTRELFAKGVRAAQEQRWDQCRAAFLAALGVKKVAQIAGNLALCEVKLGLYRDAAEHVTFFLHDTRPETPADRMAAARAILEGASAKVGTLVLTVDVAGADVAVDGRAVGQAPLEDPVFVEPGHHAIEARLGAKIATAELDVAAGGRRTVPLALTQPSAGPGLGWIIAAGVLAGGGLAAGAGLTAAANAKAGDSAALRSIVGPAGCALPSAANAGTCTNIKDAATSQTTFARAAAGAFVVGGALGLAATGLAVWRVAGSTATVRVAPVVGATEGGVIVVGAW